jgi:hypothetical protein
LPGFAFRERFDGIFLPHTCRREAAVMAGEAFEALRWGSPELIEAKRKVAAHRRRCLSLPPLKPGQSELLRAKFLADGGSVKILPSAYAAPVR